MQLSVKDIKGFKVYNHESDEPWGVVADICFNCDNATVTELIVETLSIIPITKTVKFNEINNIIKGAVILKANSMPQIRNKNLNTTDATEHFNRIEYVSDNQTKKKLWDIRFDFETGELVDLVVAKNFFSRKNHIPANKMYLKDNTIYINSKEV